LDSKIVDADFVRSYNSPAVKAIRRGDITSWDGLMELLGSDTPGVRECVERSIRMLRVKLEKSKVKNPGEELMAVIAFLDL